MLLEKHFVLVFEVFSLLQTELGQTEFLLELGQVAFETVDLTLVEIDIVFGGRVIVDVAPVGCWPNSLRTGVIFLLFSSWSFGVEMVF